MRNPIKTRANLIDFAVVFIALFLVGCDGQKIRNADTLIVDDGTNVRLLGEIKFGLGGMLSMRAPEPEPGGPVIVYVFRNIPDLYIADLIREGIPFANNAAYLWPESGAFTVESMKAATFIQEIDPELSDEDLARSFGVKVEEK